MKTGFGKRDITPRLGVELAGYSGYLNRYATAIRDRLYARALAASDGTRTAVIVSCDLVYITRELAAEVRRRVCLAADLDPSGIMVHATHTHSGPCLKLNYRNAYDPPYMELLPRRIAEACVEAVSNMREATLNHAAVPCLGIGSNRVYDNFNYQNAALCDGFTPEKPDLTDTICHVLKVTSGKTTLGFASYFGCHNVVGGGGCTYVHGDFAGIATGMLEREHPGSVGLFLQGAEGDVNTAACVYGNDEVLHALDVMASRYAGAVRRGLAEARPLPSDTVHFLMRPAKFKRKTLPIEELKNRLAEEEAIINAPAADDASPAFRMAIMRRLALQSIIQRLERGESFENTTDLQGIRIGPITFLAAPFEIFQAIKNDIVSKATAPITLVMGCSNDEQGYAPDRETSENPNDYAARTVPLWKHTLPYADIHGELTAALLEIDAALGKATSN